MDKKHHPIHSDIFRQCADYAVFIVEQDDSIASKVVEKLNEAGITSTHVSNGKEALKKVEGKPCELLVVDILLPDMTGIDLIEKLKEKYREDINFVCLADPGMTDKTAKMMEVGCLNYIVKESGFENLIPGILSQTILNLKNAAALSEAKEKIDNTIELLEETGKMASVGGWEVIPQSKTVVWSEMTREIHEVPSNYQPELNNALDFFPGEARKRIEDAIDIALTKGVDYNIELPLITLKGNKKWVHTIGKSEMKDGKCIRLHGTFQDITTRKQAEIDLQRRQAVLKRTEQIAKVGSWEWDISSDSVTWSEELYRIFRLDPKLGAPSWENQPKIYTKESYQQLSSAVELAINTGEPYQLDLEIIRGDNTQAICAAIGYVRKNDEGKVTGLYGSFQDITDRRAVERRFQEIFNATSEAILLADPEQKQMLDCNEAALKMYGASSKKELLQLQVNNISYEQYPFDQTQANALIAKAMNEGPQTFEWRARKTSGELFWVEVSISISEIAGKRLMVTVIRNVDDRKKAEQKLKETNVQLKASEQELKAVNQQLIANEQQLRAANQQLTANEKALKKSKEDAESYLGISAEIILALNNEGIITLINESGAKLLGYDKEKLIGKNWFDTCLPPDIKDDIYHVFKQGISGGNDNYMKYESAIQTKSGEIRSIIFHNNILKDDDGNITGSLSSGEDITQRKEAEESLKKSEKFARGLINSMTDGFSILDPDGVHTYVNDAFCKMTGYSRKELLGMGIPHAYWPEEEYDNIAKAFKTSTTGHQKEIELVFKKKSGERFPVIVSPSLLRDDDGELLSNFATIKDISQLKETEHELLLAKQQAEESEARYRKAQEVGHIGSWEFNLENNSFWGSEEGKRIYNLDQKDDEFTVEEVMNCVVEEHREDVNQAMTDLLNNEKPYDIVFTVIPKNTTERKIIRSIAETQKDASGKPVKVTGVLHDITLQKQTEKALVEAKERAEQSDRLKSAFLANMSHEIRTPMNGILGFSNLLKEPKITGEQHDKYLSIIQKSGKRMLNTINDLVNISKIEAGQMEVFNSDTNINEQLDYLYTFFRQEATINGIELRLEKALPKEKSVVYTDREKMYAILTNLIKNAIKYTDEGTISFGYEMIKGDMQFYVQDSGIGISKEQKEAVFDRFVQADSSIIKPYEGSGLGLSIAKAYVEMLGGKIWVESELNKGSTFFFTLPFSVKHHKENEVISEPEKHAKIELSGLTILIAEDEESSGFYLQEILEKEVGKLLFAKNGKEVLQICKEEKDIDLVLMDIKMPEIDGYEATKKVKEIDADIKVIAQTAYALEGDKEIALEAGCDAYVSKPLSKEKLYKTISELFRH